MLTIALDRLTLAGPTFAQWASLARTAFARADADRVRRPGAAAVDTGASAICKGFGGGLS